LVREDLDLNFNHLALTKTIARKICLMFIKILSGIPTVIMGETGVGKTILVHYLSRLIDGEIFTLNVHAG
jgi:MoxR-like ATPase